MSNSLSSTIVIPSLNEAARLPAYLSEIAEALAGAPGAVRILVADDGSSESEYQAVESFIIKLRTRVSAPHVMDIIRFKPNRGKGAVLRDCFSQARLESKLVGFTDADGATPFSEMLRLMEIADRRPELSAVFGCRLKALGYRVERSARRHYAGRVFATLLSALFDVPVYDSQCGAKLFRSASLTDDLLSRCTDDRWLFDTQLLISLYRRGDALLEVPVNWIDKQQSKVSLVRDAARMLAGLIAFKLRS